LDEATENAKLRCLPVAAMKEELVQLVRDFSCAHKEKSRVIHGIKFEMMATFGSLVEIDSAAVERFRLALLESNQSRLLKEIFTIDIRFTISPEAAGIIKGEKLSTGLLAIFPGGSCEAEGAEPGDEGKVTAPIMVQRRLGL